GRNDSGGHLNPSKPVIGDVADVEILAARIELDRVRLAELRAGGGSAVAGEAGLAGPRDGGNYAGAAVDLPHDVVLHLDEVHVAGVVEADFVGLVQLCIGGGAAGGGGAGYSAAGDGGDGVAPIDSADAVVAGVADVERAVGAA